MNTVGPLGPLSFRVDATHVKDRLCRFVNDEKTGSKLNNSIIKLKIFNNYPRLCLFATRDISVGEEIRYDYGDGNAPWRKSKVNAQLHLRFDSYIIFSLKFILSLEVRFR